MKKYALVTLGSMLSGCLLVSPAVSDGLKAGSEPLYAVTFAEATLDVRVKSYGCTKAKDFVIQVENDNTLTVLRKKSDRCRAMPRIIDLQIPLPVLVEGNYYVKNALVYKR